MNAVWIDDPWERCSEGIRAMNDIEYLWERLKLEAVL